MDRFNVQFTSNKNIFYRPENFLLIWPWRGLCIIRYAENMFATSWSHRENNRNKKQNRLSGIYYYLLKQYYKCKVISRVSFINTLSFFAKYLSYFHGRLLHHSLIHVFSAINEVSIFCSYCDKQFLRISHGKSTCRLTWAT